MSIDYITMHYVEAASTDIGAPLITIGFVPTIIDTHKTYHLDDLDVNDADYYTLNRNKDTWRRLIIWNAPDGHEHMAEISEVFRRIGGFTRIERLYADKYGDDAPISILFDTWNVNDFTNRLVDELTICDIHNRRASPFDKRYVTMFYGVDGQIRDREIFVEISWEKNLVDIVK